MFYALLVALFFNIIAFIALFADLNDLEREIIRFEERTERLADGFWDAIRTLENNICELRCDLQTEQTANTALTKIVIDLSNKLKKKAR
ncbi:MAG: hypothetical protein KGL39_48615 [Patescibacteria group bacterium]|nr:hypothetical protein [Patescibacteria group bacterium]